MPCKRVKQQDQIGQRVNHKRAQQAVQNSRQDSPIPIRNRNWVMQHERYVEDDKVETDDPQRQTQQAKCLSPCLFHKTAICPSDRLVTSSDHEAIKPVPGFQRLDQSFTGPLQVRVQTQRLTEGFNRRFWLAVDTVHPASAGVNPGILRSLSQRLCDDLGRKFDVSQSQLGQRPQILAAAARRIDAQALFRRR